MAIRVIDMVSGGFIKSEFFTSSGTWTLPSSLVSDYVLVRAVGGGGGGKTTAGASEIGGAGDAGEYIERYLQVAGNLTITIGAGGAINSNGSNTSAGSITANGGRAGRLINVTGAAGGKSEANFVNSFGSYGKGGRGEIGVSANEEAGNNGAVEIIWTQIEP
jgi:hypothetical protein